MYSGELKSTIKGMDSGENVSMVLGRPQEGVSDHQIEVSGFVYVVKERKSGCINKDAQTCDKAKQQDQPPLHGAGRRTWQIGVSKFQSVDE